MIRKLGVVVTAATMLLVVAASSASGLTSPNWNLNGTYTIPFTETVGPDAPGPYPYSVQITVTSSTTGEVSGTGYYIDGGGYPSVTVTGQVTGWDVALTLMYDDPGLAPYNPFELVGTIDQNGGMSGTAVDGQAREFTWLTTTGTVSLFSECAAGETFVPATGGTVTLPTVPRHNYRITATGTYFAGGAGLYDIEADAEYSQDAVQRANDDPWTDSVRNYESYGEVLLDLMVDNQNVNWGPYSPTHTYTLDKFATDTTLTFEFGIYDVYYPNNSGGLCVSLTELPNQFFGFFAPVNNNQVNIAKAGQAVPVKWRLLDYMGQPVSDPATFVSLTSAKGAGACGGLPPDDIEVYAGASGLQYLGDGYWQFNWKTPKDYAGQCRTMKLTLSDGPIHTAEFLFK